MDACGTLLLTWEQILLAQFSSTFTLIQEQAIETDKAEDLKERLGKIDALHGKEEQRVRTSKFLEQYESVIKAPELKKYEKQVESIQEIAKLFFDSAEAGRKIRELNKQIEKSREAFRKDD